jgi:hypothetical protein
VVRYRVAQQLHLVISHLLALSMPFSSLKISLLTPCPLLYYPLFIYASCVPFHLSL